MSFFRNIRSTITRGRSSSRDTTPANGSRSGSIISGRRDSLDSRTDSLFNRSDTFILASDHDDDSRNHSNNSTLDKKSKKSKVLSKFSTFTKRKKTPTPVPESGAYDHHPSDDATNTYYQWKSDGTVGLGHDYDIHTDPFNFLYEQQSSLKSSRPYTPLDGNSLEADNSGFDSSTYKKNKMPTQLRDQLQHLKTHPRSQLHEEEQTPAEELAEDRDSDKYKTVTLSSFRKSFRDRFLQQQREASHNPAWFVEVEPPPKAPEPRSQWNAKENRPDFLVFDNENYRPQSRSPVRDRSGPSSRSPTRSPVKRNDTFRVERPSHSPAPSIRIEIKNSISPNMPGRIVPVGVAKPMPSYQPQSQPQSGSRSWLSPHKNTSTTRIGAGPTKSVWSKPPPSTSSNSSSGRFQTLVQIRNDSNAKHAPTTVPQGRISTTRIQLGGQHHTPAPLPALTSYDLIRSPSKPSAGQGQRFRQTYFGGDASLHTQSPVPATSVPTASALRYGGSGRVSSRFGPSVATTITTTPATPPTTTSTRTSNQLGRRYHYQMPTKTAIPAPAAMQRRSRSPIKLPWR